MHRWRAALLGVLALTCASTGQADVDLFLGHWALNVAASHGTSMPRAMTIDMQEKDDAILYRSQSTAMDGRLKSVEYSARYDGVPTLVQGNEGLLMPVRLRRLDAFTVEASYLRGLTVAAVARREVSADGERMTISTTLTESGGEAVSTLVFDKMGKNTPF